jgi:hypothetical protein
MPIVIGFDDVPWVRDRTAASHLPELAMLSVMAHPELEIAEVAIGALGQLPEARARLYLDVIMDALPVEIRGLLEARMRKDHDYKGGFSEKLLGIGREEGREEGRQDGLRTAVVVLAREKLDQLSDADVAAIEAVSDPLLLTELVASLGKARSAARARAALDRTLRARSLLDNGQSPDPFV